MRKNGFIPAIIALVLVLGCGTPVKIKHEHNPQYNFSDLKTYNWTPTQSVANASEMGINRFKNAVNCELASKGMVMTDDNPDFLIDLHVFSQVRFGIQDFGFRWYSDSFGFGPRHTEINAYQEGTVLLGFVDAETNELFWYGKAIGSLDPDLTPEELELEYADVAARLLKKFPPSGN